MTFFILWDILILQSIRMLLARKSYKIFDWHLQHYKGQIIKYYQTLLLVLCSNMKIKVPVELDGYNKNYYFFGQCEAESLRLMKVTEVNSVFNSKKCMVILWSLIMFVNFMQPKLMKRVGETMLQCLNYLSLYVKGII